VKPGELLPSVLRTSADLGTGLSKAQAAPGERHVQIKEAISSNCTHAARLLNLVLQIRRFPAAGTAPPGPAAAKTENEQGRHAPGQFKITPGELPGTFTLPRFVCVCWQGITYTQAVTQLSEQETCTALCFDDQQQTKHLQAGICCRSHLAAGFDIVCSAAVCPPFPDTCAVSCLLRRVDAAHHQALPARPALTMSVSLAVCCPLVYRTDDLLSICLSVCLQLGAVVGVAKRSFHVS
jgi:hypothetical protein